MHLQSWMHHNQRESPDIAARVVQEMSQLRMEIDELISLVGQHSRCVTSLNRLTIHPSRFLRSCSSCRWPQVPLTACVYTVALSRWFLEQTRAFHSSQHGLRSIRHSFQRHASSMLGRRFCLFTRIFCRCQTLLSTYFM